MVKNEIIEFMKNELGFDPDYVNGNAIGFKLREYFVEICLTIETSSQLCKGFEVDIRGVTVFRRWFDTILEVDTTKKYDGECYIDPRSEGSKWKWNCSRPTAESLEKMHTEILETVEREIEIYEKFSRSNKENNENLEKEIEKLKKRVDELERSVLVVER